MTGIVHILVVDDERLIADSLADILRTKGFEATVAYSGEAALEVAMVRKPNVLISDVVMGGMSGIDLAIVFSEIMPECRIVLCSGQVATTDLLKAAESKGFAFEILAKPVHPRFILEKLNDMPSRLEI